MLMKKINKLGLKMFIGTCKMIPQDDFQNCVLDILQDETLSDDDALEMLIWECTYRANPDQNYREIGAAKNDN